jgi:hypothetical protein
MIRKFAIVVLALSVSAVSANAMAPVKNQHRNLHMMATCANGQVTAPCACASNAVGTAGPTMSKHQMCKVGQWCHTMTGACTQ